MFYYLIVGVMFGLTAGFSPGPLLALVISETLKHGIPAGLRVAVAPLITDIPIILITLFVLTRLSGSDCVIGVISLLGGCYVLYMAYESARPKDLSPNQAASPPRSLTKGVLTNALSPHPYLFWLSVGAPMLVKSMDVGVVAPILFLGGFYVCLVGSKTLLAVLVGKSRSFLSDKVYAYTTRVLALALGVFSLVLFADGLTLLGIF